MGSVRSYRELVVWQKAMALVKDVYYCARLLPKEETYGLRSQMTRAAVSIPSNIAEGQARHGTGEFLHFLGIARGSLAELETLVTLCGEMSLIPSNNTTVLLEKSSEIGRLLTALVKSLRR